MPEVGNWFIVKLNIIFALYKSEIDDQVSGCMINFFELTTQFCFIGRRTCVKLRHDYSYLLCNQDQGKSPN